MPTSRKPRAKEPTEAVTDLTVVPDQEQPEAPPSAVIVIKIVDDEGNISTDVQALGTVQATEVQTLLELGVASWRAKIGLDKSV